jgi:hypothetical protein
MLLIMDSLDLILTHRSTVEKRLAERTKRTRRCWLWTGPVGTGGYGNFQVRLMKHIYLIAGTHVIAWSLAHDDLPGGLQVMHSCDNRICVRPEHLALGTHQENINDKMQKGRHPKGSEFAHARLNEDVVTQARKRYRIDQAQTPPGSRTGLMKVLADEAGVTITAMMYAIRGKTWKHVTEPPVTQKDSS